MSITKKMYYEENVNFTPRYLNQHVSHKSTEQCIKEGWSTKHLNQNVYFIRNGIYVIIFFKSSSEKAKLC